MSYLLTKNLNISYIGIINKLIAIDIIICTKVSFVSPIDVNTVAGSKVINAIEITAESINA